MPYYNDKIESNLMHIFQERVKKEIKRKNEEEYFSMQLLAEKADIKPKTMETYFRSPFAFSGGKSASVPSLYNAKKIADALGVTIDYLTGGNLVSEIPTAKEQSAEVLLKNLCTVIANTNLRVEIGKDGKTVFTTDNVHICNFVKQVGDFNDSTAVDLVIKLFSGLSVINGELIAPHTLKKHIQEAEQKKEDDEKRAFVYDAMVNGKPYRSLPTITEEALENWPDETNKEIIRRGNVWDEFKRRQKERSAEKQEV